MTQPGQGFYSDCSQTDTNVVQAFSIIACGLLFINALLLVGTFIKKIPRGPSSMVLSLLAGCSAVIVSAIFWFKMNPFVYANSETPCTNIATLLAGVGISVKDCTEYIRYGLWFEVATFVLAFFLFCLHFLHSGLFYCIFCCCAKKPEEEKEEPEVPSNRLLIGTKLKSVWFMCTVFACFSDYVRLKTDQPGRSSDYSLWTTGPLCKEQLPNNFAQAAVVPINFGDCTLTVLSFIAAMSVMAMCFAGLSFICILPSLSYPRTFKRFGLCFTGISTVCSVVLAAVWTTAVDPGRNGLDYCSILTQGPTTTACKFSWRPGAVFAFVSLGLGAVSFILDSRILTGDGANFCPYASNPKEDELEKGQIEPDESKEDPDEVADEEGPVDSASVLSSDLEIEIEPLQVQEEAAKDEPQSPYRVPGSPLGGISRWLRASPKASTDELTDVKLGE